VPAPRCLPIHCLVAQETIGGHRLRQAVTGVRNTRRRVRCKPRDQRPHSIVEARIAEIQLCEFHRCRLCCCRQRVTQKGRVNAKWRLFTSAVASR
jgi:hypothetical protein